MFKYLPATLGIAAMLIASTALAKERSALESASVKAASDCVAAAALNNSRIETLYREGRLKAVTDWIVLKSDACKNQLVAMRLLHDRLYGVGTGRTFLLGDYLADLPRAVGERIKVVFKSPVVSRGGGDERAPPRVPELKEETELMVIGVKENDALNIREDATENSRIVDIIPPDTTGGIVYLGDSQGKWIFIRYGERAEGWVDSRFVRPVTRRGTRLP